MKIKLLYFALIYTLLTSSLLAFKPITVAIAEFKTQGASEDKSWLGSSCSDEVIDIISNDHSVRVVERQYLNKIIDEIKLQNSGVFDENSAVETGKLLGAQYFVFGTATLLNENLKIRCRIVSVATSAVIGSADVTGNVNNLFQLENELAQKLTALFNIGNTLMQSTSKVSTDLNNISLNTYNKLDKLKAQCKNFPLFGLDAARNRKSAEYQSISNACDELIVSYPRLYLVYLYKAQVCLQQENFTEAEAAIKIAKSLNSTDADIMLCNVNLYLVQQNENKALDLLTFLSNKFPLDARVWFGIAKVQASALNNHAAIEACINALRYTPKMPQAEKLLQTILGGMEGLSATQFSSNDAYTFALFYKNYFDFGAANKTTNDLAKQVSQLWSDLYLPYYVQGVYQAKMGKNELALIYLNDGLKYNFTYPYLHRELGKILIQHNNCKQGKLHINIYMKTENSIDDFEEMQKYIKKCN
ncbi:MAG: CsgG/HfaB family protein [Bacteroidia bacterium]